MIDNFLGIDTQGSPQEEGEEGERCGGASPPGCKHRQDTEEE